MPYREFMAIYGLFFLMGVEMYIFSPLLPTISQEFHVDGGTCGLVVVAYVLVYALAGPVFGNIADRTSRRTLICCGAGVFAIGAIACSVAPNFVLLVAARALTGLGGAIVGPSSWAYLAERTPDSTRARVISVGASVYALGQVIGVPAGTFIASLLGWHYTFLVIGALAGGLAALLSHLLVHVRPSGSPRARLRFQPWQSPPILFALLATFSLQAARLGTYSYMGVLLDDRFGLSLRDLGLLGLLVGLATMCGAIGTGWCFNRIAITRLSVLWMGITMALAVAAFVGLAVTEDDLLLATVFLMLWSLFGGGFQAFMQTYIVSAAPTHRAAAIAWNNSLLHGGIAMGTLLLGWTPVGGALFTTLAVMLGVLGAVCCLLAVRVESRITWQSTPVTE